MHPPDREYRSLVLRLSDLVINEDIIEGITFFNCQIVGPAIMLPMGNTRITGCTWDGDFDAFVWRFPDSRRGFVGVIALRDCEVIDCRLTKVGLAVPESQVEMVRAGFQEKP